MIITVTLNAGHPVIRWTKGLADDLGGGGRAEKLAAAAGGGAGLAGATPSLDQHLSRLGGRLAGNR